MSRHTFGYTLSLHDALPIYLGLLYPGIDPATFAADCLAKGAGLVALTRGGEGAIAWHASGSVETAPVKVDVIDTVGAGDTFQAALLTRLDELGALSPEGVRGMDAGTLLDAMRFAAQAAAITCSRRGADLPRRAMNGWLKSPEHLANIVSGKFTETGVGIAQSADGRTYVTQDFVH